MKQLELENGGWIPRAPKGLDAGAHVAPRNQIAALSTAPVARRNLDVVFGRMVDRVRVKQAAAPHRHLLVSFVASQEAVPPGGVQVYPYTASEVREIFEPLADRWEEETEFLSMTPQITGHPAYLEIMALSYPAVPLILERLKKRARPWFRALAAMTRENPAEGAETNSAAAEMWLAWGRSRGLID